MRHLRTTVAPVIAATLLCILPGCGRKPEPYTTVVAANERIKALEQNIQTITDEKKAVKEENAELRGRVDEVKAQVRIDFEEKLATVESAKADLEMKLSVSEKLRLAYQELAKQPEHLKNIKEEGFAMERLAWICLCFFSLSISGVTAFKYVTLKRQDRDNIVRLIAELSKKR